MIHEPPDPFLDDLRQQIVDLSEKLAAAEKSARLERECADGAHAREKEALTQMIEAQGKAHDLTLQLAQERAARGAAEAQWASIRDENDKLRRDIDARIENTRGILDKLDDACGRASDAESKLAEAQREAVFRREQSVSNFKWAEEQKQRAEQAEAELAKTKLVAEVSFKNANRFQAERDRLREALHNLEWVEAHGCVTGDCPHYSNADCAEPMRVELRRISADVRAALGSGSGEEGK